MKYLRKTNKIIKLSLITICLVTFSFNANAQDTPKLNDAEIAHIAVVANTIDIGYAEIAQKKTKNKDVINFAETMARDHKGVLEQATALVTKLGVTPMDNAVSQSLLKGAEETKEMLNSTKSKGFNKAYINNEVGYHKAVIAAVRDLLIPQTTNAELKALLQGVLTALEAHLKHAEMVQMKFM